MNVSVGGEGEEQSGEHVVAQVGEVLALEGLVLSGEPLGEGLDGGLFSGVAAALDVARHRACESKDAMVFGDVGSEGADGEKGSGHEIRVRMDTGGSELAQTISASIPVISSSSASVQVAPSGVVEP